MQKGGLVSLVILVEWWGGGGRMQGFVGCSTGIRRQRVWSTRNLRSTTEADLYESSLHGVWRSVCGERRAAVAANCQFFTLAPPIERIPPSSRPTLKLPLGPAETVGGC